MYRCSEKMSIFLNRKFLRWIFNFLIFSTSIHFFWTWTFWIIIHFLTTEKFIVVYKMYLFSWNQYSSGGDRFTPSGEGTILFYFLNNEHSEQWTFWKINILYNEHLEQQTFWIAIRNQCLQPKWNGPVHSSSLLCTYYNVSTRYSVL